MGWELWGSDTNGCPYRKGRSEAPLSSGSRLQRAWYTVTEKLDVNHCITLWHQALVTGEKLASLKLLTCVASRKRLSLPLVLPSSRISVFNHPLAMLSPASSLEQGKDPPVLTEHTTKNGKEQNKAAISNDKVRNMVL